MKRKFRSVLVLLVLLVEASALAAFAAHADTAQDALKHFTGGVQTFEAHFEQVQTDDHGQVTAKSSGHFWLARPTAAGSPGKFRWAYEKPYQQVTVCDGAKLWAYDPDLNQVTVREAKTALAGTPAELLSQKITLGGAFAIKDSGSDGDDRLVTLVPKSKDSDFKSIELALDKAGAPVRMRFADQIGGRSEVSFSEIKTNAAIDAAQFQFMPPKGAEVVKDGSVPKSTD
ncbi:MAG: outer membrane lipoprotein chaperone LolA [Nevskia sp.]|nr:outer membrane lipoprotein chaperone LolA [Nevskia sp.]